MGSQDVKANQGGAQHRAFMAALLRDLEALDRMIRQGRIENDQRRVGAEQELVLIDRDRRPAPKAMEILARIAEASPDDRITNELARFNLEANLSPVHVGAGMLEELESGVRETLATVRRFAAEFDCEPLLTGILPTLELRDLGAANITPYERYFALDSLVRDMRGRDFELYLKGTDELAIRYPSIMLEALNTSFQVHLQVSADEFVPMYNLAQLLAGPILAATVNSPILFGRRLWQETRIAIFQQAVDTRPVSGARRETLARVRFGDDWVRQSATEIFRTDIARFRLMFSRDEPDDSIAALDAGQIPKLTALALHNGTVYRWNRPCYGITDGKPHLRIENRYLPSGPTVLDEIANAALWIGAMLGGGERLGEFTKGMSFDHASTNFLRAARQGLDTHMTWTDGKSYPADTILRQHVIPAAWDGLAAAGLPEEEIERYLGVIEARVETGNTGAAWQLRSFDTMHQSLRRGRAVACLTDAMLRRAKSDDPVHEWQPADSESCGRDPMAYSRVGQIMSTNLFTVGEDELVALVARIMDWEHIRHILVEDNDHRLVGIISWRRVLRFLADGSHDASQAAASEVMVTDPVTATPDTGTLEAVALMRAHSLSALPIVEDERLVGIVTETDFTRIASELLEEQLRTGNDREA
ncbi:MAG: CBS domain-containing protein [Planctomycetota bacterium]|nr:MAG: CBS domain-containing protein [Planctomycetota bacterium]